MKHVRKIGSEDLRRALEELAPPPIEDAARVLGALPPPPISVRWRRLGLVPAAAVAGIAVGLLIATAGSAPAPKPALAANAGGPKLVVGKGAVYISANGGDEAPLATGLSVPMGADIRTGPEGQALFRMADGSEVLVNHSSRFRFSDDHRLHIERGEIWTLLEKHGGKPFEIVSKHGSLQTKREDNAFAAQAVSADDRELRVVMFRGKALIVASDGRISEVPAGMSGRIQKGQAGAPREVEHLSDVATWRYKIVALGDSCQNKDQEERLPELLELLGTEKGWLVGDLAFRQIGAAGTKSLLTFLLEAPATAALMEKRLHAAGLLANLAGPERYDYLLTLLDHEDKYVRERAFIALERLFGEIPFKTGNTFWHTAPREKRLEAIAAWKRYIEEHFDPLKLCRQR